MHFKYFNRHEEETKPELDESVTITKQPAVASAQQAQSNYFSQIAVLQTEHSRASEVIANASVETTEAPAEAECLAIETKTEAVQEIPNIAAEASVDAPAEAVVSQANLETEGQHGSPERAAVAPAPADEAGVPATSPDSTLAPAVETPVNEETLKEATLLAQTEARKSPEIEAHVSDETETLQTEEQPLSDITDVKHEDVHNAGDVSVSIAQPDSLTSGQSNDLDAIEKSVTKVTTTEVEEKPSEMDKVQQDTSEASETQEYLKQVSSPVVDITNGLSPAVENGLVKESDNLSVENETHADDAVVEEMPQSEDEEKPSEEPEDFESKPSTFTDR